MEYGYDTQCTALYLANKVGHSYSDVCHDWLWWQDVNDKNDNYFVDYDDDHFDDYDDDHFDVNDDENANLMTIDNYDDNWQLWWWLTIMMMIDNYYDGNDENYNFAGSDVSVRGRPNDWSGSG